MKVKNDKKNIRMNQQSFSKSVLLSILAIVVFGAVFSCSGNDPSERNEEVQQDSVPADVVDEGSHADSVTAEYLDEMIHSGRQLLLNFCYCCDCKITKPLLQKAIEKTGIPVTLVTVDVKEHIELADEYGVKQSPFYILYNETGQVVDTLYGYMENDFVELKQIQKWLKEGSRKGLGGYNEN